MAQEQELLLQLSQAADLPAAREAVRALERHYLYTWRPVGDNEANYGLINIGSDPGHALIERVTNAIDGVIEREALRQAGKRVDSFLHPRGKPSSVGSRFQGAGSATWAIRPNASLWRTISL